MQEENTNTNIETEITEAPMQVAPAEVQADVVAEAAVKIPSEAQAKVTAEIKTEAPRSRPPFNRGDKRGAPQLGKDGKPMRGPRKFGSQRPERAKPEFEQKTLDVRRVTRVVSGGRRFSFSVTVVIGDRKGKVGLGLGKAGDTSLAIDKAYKQAQKKMVQLKLTKDNSIPHEMSAKYNASYLTLMPNKGRGLIAGSSARSVFALAGIQNITAKFHSGSKNKLNNARVAIKALEAISSPYEKKARVAGDMTQDRAAGDRGPRSGGDDRGARPIRKNNFFVKKTVEVKMPSMDNAEGAENK